MAKKINGRRSRAQGKRLIGIKQGAGRAAARPFGSTTRKANRRPRGGGAIVPHQCMDAFHPAHLPLPRAIGGYTTIRLTQIISANDKTMVFAPWYYEAFSSSFGLEPLAPIAAVGGNDAVINSALGSNAWDFAALRNSGLNGCTLVPSAVSVQVMNPNALQTTTGMVYIGRLNTQPSLKDSTATWPEFANRFVSFNSPRLCSAGKLALRGVKVDAIPYNMNVLSDFKNVYEPTATAPFVGFNWNGLGTLDTMAEMSSNVQNKGFCPIVVHNPDQVALQYLLCVEYRCRFDPSNPAQASHTTHPVASDSTWGSIIKGMTNAGHGVLDIVESVAEFGSRLAVTAPTAQRMLALAN